MSAPIKEPAYVAATLRWCNARRKEQGKEPLEKLPKGERNDATSCPCGKATGLWVYVEQYDDTDFNAHPTPRCVQQFVPAFDAGKLPQYDATL
jgi:hypothetical protein